MAIDLHGTVEVPRAALYGFRDFLFRFREYPPMQSPLQRELQDKSRWIDSLLEQHALPPLQQIPVSSQRQRTPEEQKLGPAPTIKGIGHGPYY